MIYWRYSPGKHEERIMIYFFCVLSFILLIICVSTVEWFTVRHVRSISFMMPAFRAKYRILFLTKKSLSLVFFPP